MKVKRTLTIELEVYNRVEEYANKNGISASGAFSILAMQKLDEIEAMKQISQVQDLFSKMSDLVDSTDKLNALNLLQNAVAK